MVSLVIRSYLLLIAVDRTLKQFGFERLYEAVREQRPKTIPETRRPSYERLCRAMDVACVFYPKTVLCLQRSAATVFLLRGFGWRAEFVTGCALGTFENHAWVELDNCVVSDKPYVTDMYQVLDRC